MADPIPASEFELTRSPELTRVVREIWPLSPSLGAVTKAQRRMLHEVCQRLDWHAGRNERDAPAMAILRRQAFEMAHAKAELGETVWDTESRATGYLNMMLGNS